MPTLTVPASNSDYTTFACTDKQATAINQLQSAHKGFASVKGYIPSTGWEVKPEQNIQMIVGFLTHRLYKRQVEALNSLNLSEVNLDKWIPSKGKNSCDNASEQFDLCLDLAITSKQKSVDGELNNAHTDGHKRCYCTISNSIKVNFITEKKDGIKVPVMNKDGIPTVESILVPYLEVKTITIQDGIRKTKNSGSKVLMDNAINSALAKRYAFKMLSLKEENFKSLTVGKEVIESTDLNTALMTMASVS